MTSYDTLSDRALVAACRNGEQKAWDTLVQRYERLIYTIPLRYGMTKAEAEDVFQAVWLTLLRHLDSLREPDRLAAWLVTTTKHACWSQRRKHSAELHLIPDHPLWAKESGPVEQPTEEIIEQYEQQFNLSKALSRLEEPCRGLLRALYYDTNSPSYQEISQKFKMPIGSIGPTRARCLQKLRQLLVQE